MNLLGKKPEDIKKDFCYKYNIPIKEFDSLFKFLKFENLIKKTLIVVVGIVSVIIGVSFLISLASSAATDQPYSLLVFKTVVNFYQRFINITVILLEIGIGAFFAAMPFVVWSKVFNWKFD